MLLEQYADTEKYFYHGTFTNFKNYGSVVEDIAIRKVSIETDIKEEIKKYMSEL